MTAHVCFIDLDGFKSVNDRLGHAAGDELLRVTATRLQSCVRGKDTVARLGGDEFVLLLTQLSGRDECQCILDRVQSLVRQPVPLEPVERAEVSASIGVAYYPSDSTEPEALLAMADAAMYEAKRARGLHR